MALRSRKAKESDNLESEVTKEPIKATESGMETPEKEPAKAEFTKKEKIPAVTTRANVNTAVAAADNEQMQLVLANLELAIPIMPFGTLPIVKASQGILICEDIELGKKIEFTVMSFNPKYAITPNENSAPTDLCAFSYDNVMLSDGVTTVASHIEFLISEGYRRATSKMYIELLGILDDAEEDSEEIGNMLILSLSPMSVKQFYRYRLQTSAKIIKARNEGNPEIAPAHAEQMIVTAKRMTFGTNTFTIMTFSNR